MLSTSLEHIICHSLLNHFDQHNVLNHLNHGFRAGHSCETQLAVTLHDLTESFGMNTQTEILLYLISKGGSGVWGRLLIFEQFATQDGPYSTPLVINFEEFAPPPLPAYYMYL